MIKFVDDRVGKIVEKGENAGYHHFLLFPQCFQKASFPRVNKTRDCMAKGSNKSNKAECKSQYFAVVGFFYAKKYLHGKATR